MNPVECHTGDIQKLALDGTITETERCWQGLSELCRVPQLRAKDERQEISNSRRMEGENTDDLCGSGTRRHIQMVFTAHVLLVPGSAFVAGTDSSSEKSVQQPSPKLTKDMRVAKALASLDRLKARQDVHRGLDQSACVCVEIRREAERRAEEDRSNASILQDHATKIGQSLAI